MSVHRGDEKADAVNIEQDKSDKSDDMERANPDYQPLDPGSAYEKALIKKIDWRLLPMIGALYSIALVDRVNVCSSSSLLRPTTRDRMVTSLTRAPPESYRMPVWPAWATTSNSKSERDTRPSWWSSPSPTVSSR